MKLGEALVKAGLITKQQLNLVLERQVVFGGRIGTNLLELRILNEEEFTKFLSKYYKLPVVTKEMIASIPEEALHSISKELIEKYRILPLKKEGKKLRVAMLNASDLQEVDELSFLTGFNIIPYAIAELRLIYALEKYYGIKTDPRYIRYTDRFKLETEGVDSTDRISKIALTKVNDAKEIAEILLRLTYKIAERGAIFSISGEKVIPLKARGLNIEGLVIIEGELPIFSEVIKSRSFYRGPVHDTQSNAPLIKILSGTPQDALVMPVAIREEVVALIYIDNGNDSVLDANVVYLSRLASLASLAFDLLMLKKKILEF